MWYLKACRACLSTEGKLERIDEKAQRIFYNATEIQVEPGDGLPQYFCAECYTYIKKTMAFRRRSRRAFYVLREIIMLMKQVTQNDILQVDRIKTNLVSPLSYWNPEKNATYYFSTADANDEIKEEKEGSNIKDELIKSEFDTSNKENSVEDANITVRNAEKTDLLRTYISKALTLQKSDSNQTQYTSQQQTNIVEENSTETAKIVQENVHDEFVKVEPTIIKSTAILVDIKPDNWKEIEREEADKRQREIEHVLREIVGEDGVQNDDDCFDDNTVDCDQPDDVDMEDVFKGLKEEDAQECDDFEWPDPKEEEVVKAKKELKEMARERPKVSEIKVTAKALMAASIRCLTAEEEVATHKARLMKEPFKSARFKCTMCVSVFQTMDRIQEHVSYHNRKNQYKFRCRVCMNVYKSEEHLNQHCAKKHWYEYQCGACPNKHTSLMELVYCWKRKRHNMTQSQLMWRNSRHYRELAKQYQTRPLRQEQMGETIQRWADDASGALLKGGAPRGKYNCVKCKLTLGAAVKWMEHMGQHEQSDTKEFSCDVCGISMTRRKQFVKHMQWRHLFTYKCRKCKSIFYTRNQALYHFNRCPKKEKNNADEKARQYCNMCTYYTIFGRERLLQHQLSQHGYVRLPEEKRLHPDPSLYCDACGIYFTNKKWLAAHSVREGHKHTHIQDTDVICMECGSAMASETALAEHRRQLHPAGPTDRYSHCSQCEMKFEQPWQLREHTELEHDWKDIRVCELCGKTMSRTSFHKHKSQHTAQRAIDDPLNCRFCGSICYTKAHYISHMLFNHTMKPYCCTLCGGRYQSRAEARDHILKNHAPALPYTCEACDRHFAHLDYLQQHCLKLHGLDIKKTDKSVYLSKRMAGKIFIYEHMKIDGSLIETSVLSSTLIEKCDYMDENNVPIDFMDAFFFDPTVNPNRPTKFDPPHNNNKRPKLTQSDEAQPVKKKTKSSPKEQKPVVTQINNTGTIIPKITVKKEKLTALTTSVSPQIPQKKIKKEKLSNSPTQIPQITIKKGKLKHLTKMQNNIEVKNEQHDYFGNVISEKQEPSDSKMDIKKLEIKSEAKLDMPSLDIGRYNENIPDYTEEEVIESKKEEVGEETNLTEENIETVEGQTAVEEIPASNDEANIQQPNEDSNSQEETTLTEDVIGELVEHEGKYYVMVDGLLYSIQN